MKRYYFSALALVFFCASVPLMALSAPIAKFDRVSSLRPDTDATYFMDGKSGRPTLAAWLANPTTTNVLPAIHAARDYLVSTGLGGKISLPTGIYYIGDNTLLIETEGIYVEGSSPGIHYTYNTLGQTGVKIIYTGTGAGSVGVSFDSGEPNFQRVGLKNVTIQCAQTTETCLYVHGAVDSSFDDITIYGQSGTGNDNGALLRAKGTKNTDFNRVRYQGDGNTPSTEYAKKCLELSGDMTTTTFYKNYIRQCMTGVYSETYGGAYTTFRDSIVEANVTYGFDFRGGRFWIDNPWMEGNGRNFNIIGGVTGPQVSIFGGFITTTSDFGPFFHAEGWGQNSGLTLNNPTLVAHGYADSPLFDNTSDITKGNVTLNAVNFVSTGSTTMDVGCIDNSCNYDVVNYGPLNIQKYRFQSTALDNGYSAGLIPVTDNVSGGNSLYTFETEGMIVGYNVYYTDNVSAGGVTITLKNNDGSVTGLGQPIVGYQPPVGENKSLVKGKVLHPSNAMFYPGYTLGVGITTTADFAPTGGTLTIDVVTMPISLNFAPSGGL